MFTAALLGHIASSFVLDGDDEASRQPIFATPSISFLMTMQVWRELAFICSVLAFCNWRSSPVLCKSHALSTAIPQPYLKLPHWAG